MVLRSFLPKGGEIKSVAVYPSDFGVQRMKEEEIHGPVGLFDDKDEKGDEESDDEDEDEDDELVNQKMRAYEKSRLRLLIILFLILYLVRCYLSVADISSSPDTTML